MTDGAGNNTTVVVPLTLTDFAKALRELIAAFRDAVGIGKDGANVVRRHRASTAAANLDYLSFQPDGFSRHLQRIADGKGTNADAEALSAFSNQTADGVVQKIRALRGYRDNVRQQCGRDAADKLSNLIDGPNGKFAIRYEIEGLFHMWGDGKDPPLLADQASRILRMIETFNADLTAMHDTIFPPRGAPK